METNPTQQEILLLTGTTFSSREFSEPTNAPNQKHLTEMEKLAAACWNGLLPEILPEIFAKSCPTKRLYLWQVREASAFIELELGENYVAFEKEFSIYPDSFLSTQTLS